MKTILTFALFSLSALASEPAHHGAHTESHAEEAHHAPAAASSHATHDEHADAHAPKMAAHDSHEMDAHAKAAPAAAHAVHWSYGGSTGPDKWGKLDAEYGACEHGKQQSPIDLKWQKQQGNRSLEFHYVPGSFTVVDNGHTIQVNVPVGSYALIDGKKYSLLQFHFHSLSEHTFSGKHFPLEAHFVHKNAEGKLAVVGVMFETGSKNLGLEQVFLHMPAKAKDEKRVAKTFNPSQLLPSIHTHYQYSGSLTTPPCSEGVNWTVLNTPMPISEEQVAQFTQAYAHNNRPLQPVHERKPASY